MIGQIEERIDLGDGHALSRLSHLHDFVALAHLAFTQNAEVEARPAARRQQCRYPGFVRPNAAAIADDARLGDLEKCGADLLSVADTYCIVWQSLDGEVLAKLAVDEASPLQLLLPIAIRANLIHEDGSMLAFVPGQAPLAISLKIQPGDAAATM